VSNESKTPTSLITPFPLHTPIAHGGDPQDRSGSSVVAFFLTYYQKKLLNIVPTMKKFILCTVLLGLTSCVPANSSNNHNNQLISNNHTNENQEFSVFGTEPFWNVEVSPSGIVYSSLAEPDQNQTFPYVTPLSADGRFLETVRVYRLGEQNNTLLIIRKVDNCSDGMSDDLYPYSGLFIRGDMVLEGCAVKVDNKS
jgi:uncharacterized membrane protein